MKNLKKILATTLVIGATTLGSYSMAHEGPEVCREDIEDIVNNLIPKIEERLKINDIDIESYHPLSQEHVKCVTNGIEEKTKGKYSYSSTEDNLFYRIKKIK